MDITAGAGKPTERKQCQTSTTWTHSLLFLRIKAILWQSKGTREHIQEQISRSKNRTQNNTGNPKSRKMAKYAFLPSGQEQGAWCLSLHMGYWQNEKCT